MMIPVDPAQFAMAIYVTVLSGVLMAVVLRSASGLRLELKQDIAESRTELKQDIAELRSDMGKLRSEMAIMRSDLTQVALAIGTSPRAASDDR